MGTALPRGITGHYVLDDGGQRKAIEHSLQVVVDAVVLQATNEDVVNGRSRNHAKLPGTRDGAG